MFQDYIIKFVFYLIVRSDRNQGHFAEHLDPSGTSGKLFAHAAHLAFDTFAKPDTALVSYCPNRVASYAHLSQTKFGLRRFDLGPIVTWTLGTRIVLVRYCAIFFCQIFLTHWIFTSYTDANDRFSVLEYCPHETGNSDGYLRDFVTW